MIAINHLCAERRLPKDMVYEAVEAALASAYRRAYGGAHNVRAKVDRETGDFYVIAQKEVVESVVSPKTEITLEEARKIDPNVQVGDIVEVDVTPKDFGRIAAQTAKQVILQRLREAEREVAYSTYSGKVGDLVSGTIQSIGSAGVVVALDEHAEGLLPEREQIPRERYRRGQLMKFYLLDVEKGTKGPKIILSRTHPEFLRRLIEQEVPEVFQGIVEVKAIAREPGVRSKVAVFSRQPGVDPVGSCVGMRGVRIHNIVRELNGEKIDVVQWSPDTRQFIANALSPAKVINVLLDRTSGEKDAIVIVPDGQFSLAVGKEGLNAKLAAHLTGWHIDIKKQTEAIEEKVVEKYEERQRLAELAKEEGFLGAAEKILEGEVPVTKEKPAEVDEADVELVEEEVVKEIEEKIREKEPVAVEEAQEQVAEAAEEQAVEQESGDEWDLSDLEIDLSGITVDEPEEEEEEILEKPKKRKKKKGKEKSPSSHKGRHRRVMDWDEEDEF